MTKQEKELLGKLKAYFTANFMGIADCEEDGCETCGCGSISAASLEAINETIDTFIKANGKV